MRSAGCIRAICPPLSGGSISRREGAIHGPDTTQYRFRGRRPQPLSGRNPPFSDASAAGRVHARQAVSGA
ncbi:MAG: hypothetical protein WBA88_07785 [Pseudaminobacter sp.]